MCKPRFTQDEKLMEIWERLAGPRPRIVTLVPYKRELISPGPAMGVYWQYSELDPPADVDAGLELYIGLLVHADPTRVLPKLAAINNMLLVEPPFHRGTHDNLNRHLLKEVFQEEIARQRLKAGDEPKNRVVFHRLALLLNMKLLLGIKGQEVDRGQDDSLIGDLCLLANDFLSEEKYEDDRDLILESLPTWEISNPRDVAYSMSRYDLLIRDHVSGNDPQITVNRAKLKLSVGRFEGLLLDEYLTLIFAIYSLVQGRRGCVVSATNVAENLKIDRESVAHFFKGRSLSASEFGEKFAAGGWARDDLSQLVRDHRFINDTTQIRRYPFARIDDDKYLVLDSMCVVELLTSGLYWSIFECLPPQPARDREHFAELWGRAFELYTVDLLRQYYSASELSPFKGDLSYDGDSGRGQIDALIDYGNDVILFEMKASLLTLKAKCGRDWEVLEKDLTLKFVENEKGKPKALRQLARAATAMAMGRIFKGKAPDRIFPVLVVDEKAMECMGMNCYLNQLFRGFLDSDVRGKICPLTVMSIDELEELLPCMQETHVSWEEVLGSRFKGDDVVITSVHQALYNITRDKSIPFVRNDFLLKRYEEMFSRIKDAFT